MTPADFDAWLKHMGLSERAADILAAPASNADDAQAARERAWDWLDNRVGR